MGGGPAGLSAALWCADLGMQALLLEGQRELGGQLLWTHNPIDNFIGQRAANGRELRDKFIEHLASIDLHLETAAIVASADLDRLEVTLTTGLSYAARAIIIATGVRRR